VSIQPQAFEFKTSRLVASSYTAAQGVSGYHVYLNNYGKKAQPYLYFSSYYQGNDYSTTDCANYGANGYMATGTSSVTPYVDPATSRFINANSYQIITAGPRGFFGLGGTLWNPRTGATDPTNNTQDNQANFAPGLLRAGQ
jgi:hypothetical protein